MKTVTVILTGGESCEHDIGIITAIHAYHACSEENKVMVYLRNHRFFVGKKLSRPTSYATFSTRGLREVYFNNGCLCYKCGNIRKIKCVIICMHGGEGECGSVQGYLDVANVPYTSSGVTESGLFMDKCLSKRLLVADGFQTLPYVEICSDEDRKVALARVGSLGYPVVIKPALLGSSIGITFARSEIEADNGLSVSFRFCNKVLVEECLTDFIELNCAVATIDGEVVSGVVEKVNSKGFLSFSDKYLTDARNKKIPADIPDSLTEEVQNTAVEIYKKYNLFGVVRIDFLYKEKLFVNEINTIPGSLAYYLFSAKRINAGRLLRGMVDSGIRRFTEKRRYVTDFASDVLSFYNSKAGKGTKTKKQ